MVVVIVSQSTEKSGVGQVCAICKLQHEHTSQVHTWQTQKACDEALKFGIAPSDTICRPCCDDLRRILLIPVMFLDGRKKAKKQLNAMYMAVVVHV